MQYAAEKDRKFRTLMMEQNYLILQKIRRLGFLGLQNFQNFYVHSVKIMFALRAHVLGTVHLCFAFTAYFVRSTSMPFGYIARGKQHRCNSVYHFGKYFKKSLCLSVSSLCFSACTLRSTRV